MVSGIEWVVNTISSIRQVEAGGQRLPDRLDGAVGKGLPETGPVEIRPDLVDPDRPDQLLPAASTAASDIPKSSRYCRHEEYDE